MIKIGVSIDGRVSMDVRSGVRKAVMLAVSDSSSRGDEYDKSSQVIPIHVGIEAVIVKQDAARQLLEFLECPTTTGKCFNCEDPIPPKRLEAMPFARRCTDCQAKHEEELRARKRT